MSRELRNRILVTIGILFVVKLIYMIPIPGIKVEVLRDLLNQQLSFSFLYRLRQFSIFALGINPYLIASVLVMTIFYLFKFRKGLDEKRYRLHLYTIILAIFLAAIQGNGLAIFFQNFQAGIPLAANTGLSFRFGLIFSLIGAMLVVIWLAHIISIKGIGNGIILIIGLTLLNRWLTAFINIINQLRLRDNFYPLFFVLGLFILITIIVAIMLTTWKYECGTSNKQQSNNLISIKFPILLLGVLPVFFLSNFNLIANRFIGANLMSLFPFILITYGMMIIIMAFILTLIVYQPKRLFQSKKQFFPDESSENDESKRFDKRLVFIFAIYSSLLLVIWGASQLLQYWLSEVLKVGYSYYISMIVYLFVIVAIIIDLYYQIKAHREMHVFRLPADVQTDPLFCDECNERVAANDEYCKNCGVTFSDELKCHNHPDDAAEFRCVVCAKPLCAKCSILVNGRYRCENHQHIEIREGWTKVCMVNTFVEAQFVEKFLENHHITSKIFSNTMGSNYGAVKLWQMTPVLPFMVARWLGGGEIKIFVPAENYDHTSKLLAKGCGIYEKNLTSS